MIEWKVLTNKGFEVFSIVLSTFLLSERTFTIIRLQEGVGGNEVKAWN